MSHRTPARGWRVTSLPASLVANLVASLVASLVLAVVIAGCGPVGTSSASSAPPSAGPTRIPILIDVQDSVGPSRFLFALADAQNNSIGSPDLPARVAFFDLAKSATTPTATVDARFIWTIQGTKGIYAADVTFTAAGDWAADFSTTKGGLAETTRVKFQVADKSSTPAIGTKAPVTKTPTLADVDGDVQRLSTDQHPDLDFYRVSVDQAIKEHRAFVLVFATPAFCTSRQCGPTLDAVKEIAKGAPRMTFINVEPYKLTFTGGRLQPVLDAGGQLQATDVTNAWGLLTEPWIFVVDRNGIVRGSFAVIAGPEELKAAIAAVS
jgi:hypothetical protein